MSSICGKISSMLSLEKELPSMVLDVKSLIEKLSFDEKVGVVKLFRLENLLTEATSERALDPYRNFFRLPLFKSRGGSEEIFFSDEYGWIYQRPENDFTPLTYQELLEKLEEFNRSINWAIGNYFIDKLSNVPEEVVPWQQRAMSILSSADIEEDFFRIEGILRRSFPRLSSAWLFTAENEAQNASPLYEISLKKALYFAHLGGIELDSGRMSLIPKVYSQAKTVQNKDVALGSIENLKQTGEKKLEDNRLREVMGEVDRVIYLAEQSGLGLEFAIPFAEKLIPFALEQAENILRKFPPKKEEIEGWEDLFWSWIGSAQKYANIAKVDIREEIEILYQKLRNLEKKAKRPFFLRWF